MRRRPTAWVFTVLVGLSLVAMLVTVGLAGRLLDRRRFVTFGFHFDRELWTGNYDTSGKILYTSPVEDPTGGVQWNHAQGFDFQKLYSYLSKEDFHEAMAAAKELGFYTAGHIPYPVGLDGVLAEGMDEIAHVANFLSLV